MKNPQSVEFRINQKKLEKAAYVLKSVAHPVRINIIDILDQNDRMTVTEIYETLGLDQSLVSHHLSNMRDKGILIPEREGQKVYYRLVDKTITGIIDCINKCESFEVD